MISHENWNEILNNPKKPLINRSFKVYIPGSTIKAIVALSALENDVISTNLKLIAPVKLKCMDRHITVGKTQVMAL